MKTEFKEKGQSILKGSAYSMKDFIEDKPSKSAQIHKTTNPQNSNGTEPPSHKDAKDALERLHVQNRKDLADKLIQHVYAKKLSEKRASQRNIIEQALEEYFCNHR
jgi:hypothetical protein